LRAQGDSDELLNSDLLHFMEQCRQWSAAPQDRVLPIPFDELWDRAEEISRFLGFPVELPERKSRRPKPTLPAINKEVFNCLHEEYKRMVGVAHDRLSAIHKAGKSEA
jgi:hypothetical protein